MSVKKVVASRGTMKVKMKRWMMVAFIFVLFNCLTSIDSVLVWRTTVNPDAITIQYIKNETHKVRDDYTLLVETLKNYTLDEKCEKGLPFGVGFQWYNPYVDMGGISRTGYTISGIFPHVTKKIMEHCCPNSKIKYGRHFIGIQEIEENAQVEGDIDIYFPLYAQNGEASTTYKDYPFIPIVTAPRIVVLVPERLYTEINKRMGVLVKTILSAWPMLVFTVVSTMLAGLVVWFLDRKRNATEFPPMFYQGAWEGIWWAFVTMTTVGYGDRSPRSPYARAFCIIWILVGIVLISMFTGLITSALSASSTPVFNLPGSVIGSIFGSVEYKIGVGYNAEMRTYHHHAAMFHDLIVTKNMHAVMIDNFILSANAEHLEKQIQVRMERELEAPITYGIALGDMDSRSVNTYKCFRKYVDHNQHQIFSIIATKLRPIRNPTDKIRLEVAASESFFYEDGLFKTVVFTELGILIIFFIFGFLSEKWASAKIPGFYHKLRGNPTSKDNPGKSDECSLNEIKIDENIFCNNDKLLIGDKPPPIITSTTTLHAHDR